MADHAAHAPLRDQKRLESYASQHRWRHQESSAYASHANPSGNVRDADERNGISDLADSLNSPRVEGARTGLPGTHKPIVVSGHNDEPPKTSSTEKKAVGNVSALDGPAEETRAIVDVREVRCGPLLNYRRMEGSTWHGSVLIVTRGGISEEHFELELNLRGIDSQVLPRHDVNGTLDVGRSQEPEGSIHSNEYTTEILGDIRVKGAKLYADPKSVFWRFDIQVEMQEVETHWEYRIPNLHFTNGTKTDRQSFFVPALSESMRIMFYSCNGFSIGTDEKAWSGPALWNDVLRVHNDTPFHVMIGGGDQLYNDGIRVHGPLRLWSNIKNPKSRRDYPFPESLRKECDEYYASNYIKWYSTEPFASANGQIPQLNIWDDHDIIDGFGSYVDSFMKCDVFRGIGGTAYKYYVLFQHHLPPPASTYTTDAPQTMVAGENGVGLDVEQLKDTFVLQNAQDEPCYIIGKTHGPYVAERSRSMYAKLGARMAFLAIDARTERTRHQVNYPETYDLIFARLRKEFGDAIASTSPTKHLILLLGVPIAYPRLTWLENILKSPLIGPIKFLNRRFGVAGSFFNHFDGSVDLLDDLDDHYTAKAHKEERLQLVLNLQKLAAEFSVRITILGGDVHLAALGRFYSNPKLGIPVVADHRYMVNIISSAIVNKPPPQAIANLLARRNKLHHLDEDTDETLLKIFDKDPGCEGKTAPFNRVTMPSRNWAMITENPISSSTQIQSLDNSKTPNITNDESNELSANKKQPQPINVEECTGKDGHLPLHPGEVDTGTNSRAATSHGQSHDGSLDVCIRVEKDRRDKEGHTEMYGMWIPVLKYEGAADRTLKNKSVVARVLHGTLDNGQSS